jgi:hypothetical protein
MSTIIRIDFDHLAKSAKEDLVEVCKHLGLRRDWARVTKPEMIAMLRGFGPSQIIDGLKEAGYGEEDIQDLLLDGEESETEDDEAARGDEGAAEVTVTVTDTATPAVTSQPAKAPDVSQVAGLLAQLLASGKAGLDKAEVQEIVKPMIDLQIESVWSGLTNIIDESLKAMPAREIIVKSERAEVKIEGLQHHKFERLLRACSARQPDGHRLNVYLYGPPGTGKTTAARNVAKALGLAFHCNGAVSTKYELTGFIDANGVCHSPEFRKAWEKGGVYLFDEIDGSVSAAVVAFNAALANGVMAFPDGMLERHPDCVVIAAANTVHGATAEFTGRSKLDAASLDRFILLDWPIDDTLEEAMAAGRDDWLREVRRVRRAVSEKGIKVMVTPRATVYGASLLHAGMPFDEVRELTLRKGMNDQQWAMVA